MFGKIGCLLIVVTCVGCGDVSRDNESIGQVKKVHNETPLILMDHQTADISLGVMINGVGSMSKEDMTLYVPNAKDYDLLSKAAETGQLVKFRYDIARLRFNVPNNMITHVEFLEIDQQKK